MHNEIGKVYERPWGSYETLVLGSGFQIKLIHMNPQGRLSLQKHFKRSEHWVVVKGEPTITVEGKTRVYRINEAVFIPQEAIHRIENLSEAACCIVEVQVGEYLGEDDIVRMEDIYGRQTINLT